MSSEVSAKSANTSTIAVFALRSKLRWQKICRLDEGIIKNTKIELAKAYSSRAAVWGDGAESATRTIGDIVDEPYIADGEGLILAAHGADRKVSLWRAAVLSSKAANLFAEAREFLDAGAAWEFSAKNRRSLSIYARWETTSDFNSRKAAVSYLLAGAAYANCGNNEKAQQLLSLGTTQIAYHWSNGEIPSIAISTSLEKA